MSDEITDDEMHKFYNREEFETFTTSELIAMRKSITAVLLTRLPECKELIAELEPAKTPRAPRGTGKKKPSAEK